MPVLVRTVESLGIPTVTVTMMPDVAQKYRLSRVVGVEVPFGHTFGMPNGEIGCRLPSAAPNCKD